MTHVKNTVVKYKNNILNVIKYLGNKLALLSQNSLTIRTSLFECTIVEFWLILYRNQLVALQHSSFSTICISLNS